MLMSLTGGREDEIWRVKLSDGLLSMMVKAELLVGWSDVPEGGNLAFRFVADHLEGFVVKYGKIYGY